MTTPNQTVNILAAQWYELVIEQERLMRLIDNPICGKPGHGFKASRKAKTAKRTIDQQLATLDMQILNWQTRNGKASKQERAQRWEAYQKALYTIDFHLAP